MSLYNNKKQEKEFNLHKPKQSTYQDCRPLKGFVNFDCTKSYVLADSTGEFNCIGWAVGVKEFIDPTQKINKYYDKKTETGMITVQFHSAPSPSQISLHEYQKSTSACMDAATLFFKDYKNTSVLPQKDDYVAMGKISYPPIDDTIAFYFKEGQDQVVGRDITIKGFQHAARYVKDVNSWVSDIWTSKLGEYKLMTHEEHELDGDIYGYILCYLVPMDSNTFECPNNINHPFETIADTCPV